MTIAPAVTTTQVYQVFIRASAQQIWDAITQPEFTVQYFYGARVETTGEPPSPFRHVAPDGTVMQDGVVLEFDPPVRLVMSWHPLWAPELAAEAASRVTWEIEGRPGGIALLTVVHDQLEASPKTAQDVSGEGWMTVLSGLKTLIETGTPLVAPE